MSLTKHASFTVLSAKIAQAGAPLLRTAHRHAFTYEPKPGFLYVRSRAISSRCNDNFDEFPADEIKTAYRTFIGKPVFVNHHNDNHRRARGVIKDAVLHEDSNPDGSPDTWVEVLMEVDAIRFPKLAKAILAGEIDRTSMGTDVAYSVCSFCGNKASNPVEYCSHIPKLKGTRIYRRTASGAQEGILVREICFGLGFFENSLLVEEPADPTAYFLGVDDHSGLTRAASKTATACTCGSRSTNFKDHAGFCPMSERESHPTEATPIPGDDSGICFNCHKPMNYVEGRGWYHGHSRMCPTTASRKTAEVEPVEVAGLAIVAEDTGRILMIQRSFKDEDDPARGTWEFPGGHLDDGEHPPTAAIREFSEEVGCEPPHGDIVGSWRSGPIYQGFVMTVPTEGDVDIHCRENDRAVNPDDPKGDDLESVAWWTLADAKANPALRKEVKSGTDWSVFEPVVKKAKTAAKDEHRIGPWRGFTEHPDPLRIHEPGDQSQWDNPNTAYFDGIHDGLNGLKQMSDKYAEEATAIAYEEGYDLGAQQRVASLRTAMPGPFPTEHEPYAKDNGDGTHSSACNCGWVGENYGADRVLAHLKAVLHSNQIAWDRGLPTGAWGTPVKPKKPKTAAALRYDLTLDCGDKATYVGSQPGQVEIGKDWNCSTHGDTRVAEVSGPGTMDKGLGWDKESSLRVRATHEDRLGIPAGHAFVRFDSHRAHDNFHRRVLEPGEATVPLVSMTKEQIHAVPQAAVDRMLGMGGNVAKGVTVFKRRPDLSAYQKPISKSSLNETIAPKEVDTLRDEKCPVCGEADSYDGDKCQVCGFVAPPGEFSDPDLEVAKATDLRQDKDDAKNKGGDLVCSNCGAHFSSSESVQPKQAVILDPAKDSDDATADAQATDTAPKVGDPCPDCGEGTLELAPDADSPAGETQFLPAGSASKDDADDEDSSDDPDDQDGKDGTKPPFVKKKPTAARSREHHVEGVRDLTYSPSHDLDDGRDDRLLAVAGAGAGEWVRDGVRSSSGVRVAGGADSTRAGRGSRLGEGLSGTELREPGAPRSHYPAGERAAHQAAHQSDALPEGPRVHPGEHPGANRRHGQGVRDLPHRVHGSVPAEAVTPSRPASGTHEGVDVMRPALAALAAQQQQINNLREAVAFIADVAGIKEHPRVTAALAQSAADPKVTAALTKAAADENPAFGGGWDNGAPKEGAPEAPSESTQQAATPAAKADVEAVGEGPLTDVSADATTSVTETGTVLDTPLDLNEQDVTAPVAGTDTLGKGEVGAAGTNRVETDVVTGTPADNSAAFRDGGFLGAKDESRAFASLRLARLQVQSGIAVGDDIELGQMIASSNRSDEAIQGEIETLAKVVTASSNGNQRQAVARSLVPQSAHQATRTVPSMTGGTDAVSPQEHLAAVSSDEVLFEG